MLIPKTPPVGRLEFLPEGTIAAAAKANGSAWRWDIVLQCWIPGFQMELRDVCVSDEDFIEEHCDSSCDYYYENRDLYDHELVMLRDLPDGAGDVIAATVTSVCPCCSDGLGSVNFPCKAGHSDPSDGRDGGSFEGPPMLFELDLLNAAAPAHASRRIRSTWRAGDVRAFSQAAYVRKGDGKTLLCLAGNDRSLNIHSGGSICWGENDAPSDLASTVETYSCTDFNADLMSYPDFHRIRGEIATLNRNLIQSRGDSASWIKHDFVLGNHSAMLVLHPQANGAAYALLRAMGCTPQDDGLLVLPLMWRNLQDESGDLISAPLPCGLSALVRPGPDNTGVVIGQAPCCNDIPLPLSSHVPQLELAHA